MKRRIVSLVSILLSSALISTGCSAGVSEINGASIKSAAQATAATESNDITEVIESDGIEHIVSTTVITKVEGDGQKVAAIAIQYDNSIDADSLSIEDYTIADYTITDIYTNSTPDIVNESTAGNYVIVLISTDYITDNYRAEMGASSGDKDSDGGMQSTLEEGSDSFSVEKADRSQGGEAINGEGSFSNGEMGEVGEGRGANFSMDDGSLSNQLAVTLTQNGDILTLSGEKYLGSDTEIDSSYEENINLVVDDFEQFVYANPENSESTLMYNIYIPEGYDEGTSYPVVLFMPDATATGADPVKTLTQGLGAIIWAESDSQEKNTCFVLAPQYASDDINDVENTFALLALIMEEYNIDADRVYVTGQSAGTIRAIQMMIDNPDLFAAALLVAGQADSAYIDRLDELKDQNIWMIASTGDERALPGMTAIMETVEAAGTVVTEGAWSATLSEEEQNATAETMAEYGTTINFTVLSDVVPETISDNATSEHLNTWRVAYSISAIRDWIFAQSK